MHVDRGNRGKWLIAGAVASSIGGVAVGQEKYPAGPAVREPAGAIKLVQDDVPIPTAPTQPGTGAPVAPSAPLNTPPANTAQPRAGGVEVPTTQSGGATNAINFGGGGTGTPNAQAASSQDLGDAISKSGGGAGIEIQKRNTVVSDPRIRGRRAGQFGTLSNGAPYFPARLDLDTPVSKFDPGSVADVIVHRGPYTTLLGQGFAFLDIATLDSPRSRSGGVEYGGRTSLGYQTNGAQVNALQSVSVAGDGYGFRGTYNILQGNDYRAGDGSRVPSSYLSNTFNFALGFDLLDGHHLEFKGLRSRLEGVEFPGLIFDIDQSDTEAYSLRYRIDDAGVLGKVELNTWYNGTTGRGDTRASAKQGFVRSLLRQSFAEVFPQFGTGNASQFQFEDTSTTSFAERSIGYRLLSTWGGSNRDEWTLTAGTDLNVFGQSLEENIRFTQQTQGLPGFGQPQTQNQSIPSSNAVNPGLFYELATPVNNRIRFGSGARVDFVHASTNPRLITGNVNLFGLPGQTFGNANANAFVLNPGIYSADPAYQRQPQDRTDLTNNTSRNFTLLSGFIKGEYDVDDHTKLLVAYGYAERAPTLTELYASGPFIGVLQQGTSRLIGDPTLKSERLNQIDVGLNWDYDWLKAGANGFYSWINNYITYDANRTSATGGLTQVTYRNTELATLAGGELFATADLSAWVQAYGTVSYVQGIDQTHVDNSGNPNLASSRRKIAASRDFATDTEALPQMPPMETRLGIRLHQPCKTPRWQLDLSARIVNGQNTVATSLGENTTPGFTTFDVRGYYNVRPWWTLSAGAENIGDILYREHLDPIASNILRGNGFTASSPLYRPGFNFFVTSQLTY